MQACIDLILNCPTAYFSAASLIKAEQFVFLIRRQSCRCYSAAGVFFRCALIKPFSVLYGDFLCARKTSRKQIWENAYKNCV